MSSRARSASRPCDPARRERRGRGGRDDGQRHRPGLGVRGRGHLAAALGTHHRAGGVPARLVVPSDHAALDIHDEDLAGTQPSLLHDIRGVERHGAGLGGGRDDAGARDGHGHRAQAVSVEHRAHPGAVAEGERGRAVPRRHEAGGAAAKAVELGLDVGAQRGGVRDGDQQRSVEAPARRDHQVEDLVERVGVGDAIEQQRLHGREAVADPATQLGAPSAHLLAVAAHGVDLAVVGEDPEGLRERPGGVGVGGVPLMEHDMADRQVAEQVGIQRPDRGSQDEALVDHGARRRGHHRESLDAGRASGDLGAAAGEQQAPVEVRAGRARRRGDDGLGDRGQALARLLAERVRIDGHRAPAVERQPLGGDGLGHDAASAGVRLGIRGQEQADDPEVAAQTRREERPDRWLEGQQHAGAVRRGAVRGEGTAMSQGAQPRECERQHLVPRCPGRSPPRSRRHMRRARSADRRGGTRGRRTRRGTLSRGRRHRRSPAPPDSAADLGTHSTVAARSCRGQHRDGSDTVANGLRPPRDGGATMTGRLVLRPRPSTHPVTPGRVPKEP